MYFIDRGKIKKAIVYMDALLALYEENNNWDSLKDQLALERLSLGAIEAVIDVGNSMIDGFIMRDPGSYEDIIDILVDEKVITPKMDQPLKEVVGLRKMLVRDFIAVDHKEIVRIMDIHLDSLKQFGPKVSHYLEHELGPVSAFIPENDDGQN